MEMWLDTTTSPPTSVGFYTVKFEDGSEATVPYVSQVNGNRIWLLPIGSMKPVQWMLNSEQSVQECDASKAK